LSFPRKRESRGDARKTIDPPTGVYPRESGAGITDLLMPANPLSADAGMIKERASRSTGNYNGQNSRNAHPS